MWLKREYLHLMFCISYQIDNTSNLIITGCQLKTYSIFSTYNKYALHQNLEFMSVYQPSYFILYELLSCLLESTKLLKLALFVSDLLKINLAQNLYPVNNARAQHQKRI